MHHRKDGLAKTRTGDTQQIKFIRHDIRRSILYKIRRPHQVLMVIKEDKNSRENSKCIQW